MNRCPNCHDTHIGTLFDLTICHNCGFTWKEKDKSDARSR
jgi:uncharacterized protein (DUF983 family)